MAEGRGGVVKKFLTTPPRLHELMWLRGFSCSCSHPLLLLRSSPCRKQKGPQSGLVFKNTDGSWMRFQQPNPERRPTQHDKFYFCGM